jgi:hypothetical protein
LGQHTLFGRQPPAGVVCPKCGGSTFRTSWQTHSNGTRHVRCDCASCGAFVRWLKQEGAPGPRYRARRPEAHDKSMASPGAEDWWWLGLIRPGDGVWYPAAMSASLAGCWDTLLHNHLEGDYLLMPVRPPGGGGGPGGEAGE